MKLSIEQLDYLVRQAEMAAVSAGEYIQARFDKAHQQQHKIGGDSLASQVVTEVDLKAQEILLRHLEASIFDFDLGLLTEESEDDQSRLVKDYFWCIDPLDGTLPFTEKRTGYAVSIALVSKAGDPVVAAVYIPDTKDCYLAVKNEGVNMNGERFFRSPDDESVIHWYMDQSLQNEGYYGSVKEELQKWAISQRNLELKIHSHLGGVRNALGVLSSGRACYFKYPKQQKGCGSIWDYAATRLIFEEAGLIIRNANGQRLHLNAPQTTFMNQQGILFATDQELAQLILSLK